MHKLASHTHTHTEANNGAIIMVTLVMTYTNFFFDLNLPNVAMVIKKCTTKVWIFLVVPRLENSVP